MKKPVKKMKITFEVPVKLHDAFKKHADKESGKGGMTKHLNTLIKNDLGI